jgi:hypothetical protein
MGWTSEVRFPTERRVLSLFHSVQIGSEDHQTPYPMDARALSLAQNGQGVKLNIYFMRGIGHEEKYEKGGGRKKKIM